MEVSQIDQDKLASRKSILAKLLASENITVEHKKVKTAYFELNHRTLVCPIWDMMDEDLYDLLMGHEVGHALFTPLAGWHSATLPANNKRGKNFRGFLNICEDARIERKMKLKYPGLSKSFLRAYKELYERDFFGIKRLGLDGLSKLGLIDRINLHFKIGMHLPVRFSTEERVFVNELCVAETWEQVADLAARIFDFSKNHESLTDKGDLQDAIDQAEKENRDSYGPDDSDDDEGGEFDKEDDYSDGDDGEESDDDDGAAGGQNNDGEEGEGEEGDSDKGDSDGGEEGEPENSNNTEGGRDNGEKKDGEKKDPAALTDEIFREKEESLSLNDREVYMVTLPDANLKDIIVPNEWMTDIFEGYIHNAINKHHTDNYGKTKYNPFTVPELILCAHAQFKKRNASYISLLLKEFEMRKNAAQYARTSIAKTGELDLKKLYKYRLSNDIFKKIDVVSKGKSHGLVLFLDMSGSMSGIFKETVDQLLVLAEFCKRANIPFDAYGFADCFNHFPENNPDLFAKFKHFFRPNVQKFESITTAPAWGEMRDSSKFHLKHLIGTGLSRKQYKRSLDMLMIMSTFWNWRYNDASINARLPYGLDFDHAGMELSGTPTEEMLLSSRDIINKFKKVYTLDIVSVIHLTDGQGSTSMHARNQAERYLSTMTTAKDGTRKENTFYYIDNKTKIKIRCTGQTQQKMLTQLVGTVTGCKHIGYYLCPHPSYSSMEGMLKAAAKKQWNEHGYLSRTELGYEKYFYLRTNFKDDSKGLVLDKDMSARKIAKAFGASQNRKLRGRKMVGDLAGEIAV